MRVKWYDIITLGITWIIKTYRLGKLIRKVWKEADEDQNGKLSAYELKKLISHNYDWWKDKIIEAKQILQDTPEYLKLN